MARKDTTYEMSPQQKEAIRRSRQGFVPTPEHRKKISEVLKGKKYRTKNHLFP